MSGAIYVVDSNIRHEQIEAIQRSLPSDWVLLSDPAAATVILTEHVDVTEEILAAAGPGLQLIARLAPGRAAVAATAARVVDLPNTALIGVAEHAITLILTLSRHLLRVARETAAQRWATDVPAPTLTDQRHYAYNWIGLTDFGTLYGQTVGIVGLGYVGRAVALRLMPFGVRLLYTQRHRLSPDDERALGVEWRDLEDLLRESDAVTLHHRFQDGPDGNDRQFGAAEFRLMKPSAYLINTSRGRVVDEDALATALAHGEIAGAGLDVFRYEPLPPESPLLRLAGDGVILTPHVAGAPVSEAWQVAAAALVEHVRACPQTGAA